MFVTFNPDNFSPRYLTTLHLGARFVDIISPGYLTTLLPGSRFETIFTAMMDATLFADTASFVRRCRDVFRKIVVFACIVQLNLSLVTEATIYSTWAG